MYRGLAQKCRCQNSIIAMFLTYVSQVQAHDIQRATRASHSGSLVWQLAIALLVYLLCTFIPPVLLKVVPDGFAWKVALPWV
jgi:hypothetical protein